MVRSYPRPTTTISEVARRNERTRQGERQAENCGRRSSPSEGSVSIQGGSSRSRVAGFGAGTVQCEVSIGRSSQDSEGRCPETDAPGAPGRRSICACGEIGGRPGCRLEEARIHARVRPMGERLDLCLQYVARVRQQLVRAEDQVRIAQEVQRQTEEKLKNGLRDLEVLRLVASEQTPSCPPNATPREMDVEPNEEITRLRAQVAQLQLARQATEGADCVRASTNISFFMSKEDMVATHQTSC